MTRSAKNIALVLVMMIAGFVYSCAFDTSPQLDPKSDAPQDGAPNAPVLDDAQRDPGAESVTEELGEVPNTADPGAGDPGTADPGTADPGTADPGTADPGVGDPVPSNDPPMVDDPPDVTGVPPEPPVSADAGTMPVDSASDPSLIDDLRDWIAASPRVKEADALRRIMAAISSRSGPPDVKGAVEALGDVDCRRNAETCVRVCSWAVFNCQYCSSDAACVADMTQNCNRGCP
jgi:hypothetical protein